MVVKLNAKNYINHTHKFVLAFCGIDQFYEYFLNVALHLFEKNMELCYTPEFS